MKLINKFVLIIAVLVVSPNVNALPLFDIPETIFAAMKVGNAEELSKHFNSSIELVILDQEDVYSKQQAEQIVRNFFLKHKVKSFRLLHQGGKEDAQYAIGTLETEKGDFRVYFLVKQKNDRAFIHQLRIELE
jgi:Ni,Fe-hydrogenase III component G